LVSRRIGGTLIFRRDHSFGGDKTLSPNSLCLSVAGFTASWPAVINSLEHTSPEKQKPAEGRALHTGLTFQGNSIYGRTELPWNQAGSQAVNFR
jgi:hypothetical protein